MSLGKRAYDLLRSHVNREWDRIQGIEESDARYELAESLKSPVDSNKEVPIEPTLKRANDRDRAAKILGVDPKAPFSEVRKAFEKLEKRADPPKFVEGTTESIQAAKILKEIRWAYGILTEDVDSTSKRFGTLEID